MITQMLPSPFHLDNHSHILSFNHFDVPTSLDPDNFSKSPSSLGLDSHSDVQDNHFLLSLEFCQNDIFTENYIFKSPHLFTFLLLYHHSLLYLLYYHLLYHNGLICIAHHKLHWRVHIHVRVVHVYYVQPLTHVNISDNVIYLFFNPLFCLRYQVITCFAFL